jgi:hypothetical protein
MKNHGTKEESERVGVHVQVTRIIYKQQLTSLTEAQRVTYKRLGSKSIASFVSRMNREENIEIVWPP